MCCCRLCPYIYAYQVLKDQLDGIKELRFIFASPALWKRKLQKKNANFTSHALTASAIFTERRAARRKELQGEAYYQYMSSDFKHINRLHGLSAISYTNWLKFPKKYMNFIHTLS